MDEQFKVLAVPISDSNRFPFQLVEVVCHAVDLSLDLFPLGACLLIRIV